MLDRQIAEIRRFNRYYTRLIGVLEEVILRSPYSLTEARVLYELAHTDGATAGQVGEALGLDAGNLSRLVKKFHRLGLVKKERAKGDGRQTTLRLTPEGRDAFKDLDGRSQQAVAELVGGLGMSERQRLVACMREIEGLLGPSSDEGLCLLREPLAGELGWVVARHGELYSQEYGWGEKFEGLVAMVVAEFLADRDPSREKCWIAERDGRRMGMVMLVAESESVARLRLLLVEPRARGQGIGGILLRQCVNFAGAIGYKSIVLWTQSVLTGARRLYEHAGFELVSTEKHTLFGPELEGETWQLKLK